MKFAETHFERNSRNAAWAKKMLTQRGFLEAIVTAVQEKPLACIDVLRCHLRPVSDRPFTQVMETDEFHKLSGFVQWLLENAAENGMPQVALEGEILTQAIVAWHTSRFDIHGRQSYVPSEALSRLLLSTELRGLKCSDLTLPYPSVYISVDPTLGFQVHNEQTGAHPLYGMYITDDSREGHRGWRVLLCGDRNAASTSEWDDALSHFHLDLSDDEKPVTDAIAALFVLVRSKGPDWCRKQGMKDSDLEEIIETWAAAFKWAMNLLFYVTRPDFKDMEHVEANDEAAGLWRRMQNAPKGSKKRERLLDQYRGTPKRPRILVGRRVVVDERLPRTRAEAHQAVLVRILVAGHWMRYHTGAGRSQTVWKFRAAFWRGPDDSPTSKEVVRVLL